MRTDSNLFSVHTYWQLEKKFLARLPGWNHSSDAAKEAVRVLFNEKRAAIEGSNGLLVTSLYFDETGQPKLLVLGFGKGPMSHTWKPDEALRIYFGPCRKVSVRVR